VAAAPAPAAVDTERGDRELFRGGEIRRDTLKNHVATVATATMPAAAQSRSPPRARAEPQAVDDGSRKIARSDCAAAARLRAGSKSPARLPSQKGTEEGPALQSIPRTWDSALDKMSGQLAVLHARGEELQAKEKQAAVEERFHDAAAIQDEWLHLCSQVKVKHETLNPKP